MEKRPCLQLREILKNERVFLNLSPTRLIEAALQKKEAILTSTGALSVTTGKYTGRSPNDRYIVNDKKVSDHIAWGAVNRPLDEEKFDRLYDDMMNYMRGKEWFVFDGFVGSDSVYRMPIRVVNEYAWQNLFAHQMFIRPSAEELKKHQSEFTVVCAPGFKAEAKKYGLNSETFIIIHLTKKVAIIGGTEYAGEMKKSIFSVMNYLLPKQGVLPMHCSANVGERGDVALFFGLSGTGKTTLSTDPVRRLIGDDEHGWSEKGVFNMEGGCYAKCIRLSEEAEPQIWKAIRFGSVLENVVVDEQTRMADYDNGKLTENTRVAYPIDFIRRSIVPGVAGHARVILFLSADAFGVLPPISKLTKEQAMYYFLSGYTSKLAGTERGVSKPEATFSACFGAPFLPLPPIAYARMLGEKLADRETRVYLINTGWTGGAYGAGSRIRLQHTRAMVSAALDGSIEKVACVVDPVFQLLIPKEIPGVPSELLIPKNTWKDKEGYEKNAKQLAAKFARNFKQFGAIPTEIAKAGPVA